MFNHSDLLRRVDGSCVGFVSVFQEKPRVPVHNIAQSLSCSLLCLVICPNINECQKLKCYEKNIIKKSCSLLNRLTINFLRPLMSKQINGKKKVIKKLPPPPLKKINNKKCSHFTFNISTTPHDLKVQCYVNNKNKQQIKSGIKKNTTKSSAPLSVLHHTIEKSNA